MQRQWCVSIESLIWAGKKDGLLIVDLPFNLVLARTCFAFGRDDQLLIKWRLGGKRDRMQKNDKKWIRSNEPYCRHLQAGIDSEPLSSGQLDQAKVYNIASDRIFLCTSVHESA